jgi:hypothetical protein
MKSFIPKIKWIAIPVMALFACAVMAQNIPVDSLYFGQTPPGGTPQIFAPGIISLPGRVEYGISIAPAGDEMLFALGNWPNKRTMIVKYQNNHWTTPDTVSFSTTRSAEEAIYSPDGSRVYYYAYNPPTPVGGADLCYSIKIAGVWSEPVNLETPLNTTQDEYHPCVVSDSSIYFENVSGKICYSKYQNGNYLPRVLMSSLFNDPAQAWGNPYVAPDESYFIFNSPRPGGFGNTDLYIAYKKPNGSWTNPKNLGNKINTATVECGAEITDDLLYMTFVSNNDIYWVSSGFIDSLRHTNFIPYVYRLIPQADVHMGEMFAFTVPDSTFIDDDGNQTLTYSARLTNGDPLPGWMTFDSVTGTFSGVPPVVELLNIRVTATDTAGASAFTNFLMNVLDPTFIPYTENADKDIRIYPNPSEGIVNVLLPAFPGKQALSELRDLQGRLLDSRTFTNQSTYDLTPLPKGIYLMKLAIGGEVFVGKICIR